MQLKNVAGHSVEVAETEILRAAGRIFAGRRKRHGGPARKQLQCCWCSETFLGHALLEAHQRAGCVESPGAALGLPPLGNLLDA
jgi:hypothetical protein